MPSKILVSHFLLFLSTLHVNAQGGTLSVGPLETCSLTTFACPGVSGCCTIGACCGSGCCAVGYSCINEGTSTEACCSVNDPTKCGTQSSPTSYDSGQHRCTGVQNCNDITDGSSWACYLGQTCGASYRECYPCTHFGGDGSGSSDSSSPTSSDYSSSTSSSASESSSSLEKSSAHHYKNVSPGVAVSLGVMLVTKFLLL